jgi:L-threonylcarbamoyladenylate synthase
MAVMNATAEAIAAAAVALRGGALVAFPTETVYGLGADAASAAAVAALFAAKGRPAFNPLIIHVADLAAAQGVARFSPLAHKLALAFWPGALTLVLPKAHGSAHGSAHGWAQGRAQGCAIVDLATAGLQTIAVRVPAHQVARALIKAAGIAIAAPSANRSGHVSPTTAAHVASDLGDRVSIILDAGPTPVGLESTVVDATGKRAVILRPGGITRHEIAALLGEPVELATGEGERPASPGLLAQHYAPATKLRLQAKTTRRGEALLAFGKDVPKHCGALFNLSAAGDLGEAAANLFAALRVLDAAGASAIAVMPIPETGLGEAINDRLRRAAAAP